MSRGSGGYARCIMLVMVVMAMTIVIHSFQSRKLESESLLDFHRGEGSDLRQRGGSCAVLLVLYRVLLPACLLSFFLLLDVFQFYTMHKPVCVPELLRQKPCDVFGINEWTRTREEEDAEEEARSVLLRVSTRASNVI